MRISQATGKKGSLKWIQLLINDYKEYLNKKIIEKTKNDISSINWVSPLKEDDFAEYRDTGFLTVLKLEEFKSELSGFWPARGPQWDALGYTENKDYFIVEAKANIPEIISSCQAKSPASLQQIQLSIDKTKQYLNASSGSNWIQGFYQYANRISHLYFLRKLCGVNAHLIFIYFCNDSTHITTGADQWSGAINLQKQLMSLKSHKLQNYVIDLFIDINEMKIEQMQ